MLSRRGASVLFILLFSGALAGVVSLANVVMVAGVDAQLVSRWLRHAAIGWLVAFPTAMLIAGPLRRGADALVK
ncbi:MAG TPA: DUF2798 domain-containing protein [Phycisphaerales bacterium]